MAINKFLQLEIEEKSFEFRSKNGYGGTEPIILSSLLLKNNVITLFKPLSIGLAGMSIKASKDLRFMLINQKHIVGKQHFTIAHEIYHLFIQEKFESQKCITGLFDKQTDIEEKKADYFAAYLLMPKNGVLQLIPFTERQKKNKITTETLFKIQQYYRISIKAVIYRLCELDLIDKTYFDKYESGIKNITKNLGYELDLYNEGNFNKVIGDYGGFASRLYKQNKISESHYFELLNAINVDPLATTEENGNEQ